MVCKITLRWKKLNLMLNKWYCQVVFWTSPPMSFALVVSLRWYFVPSWVSLLWSSNPWILFSRNIRLNFLTTIDWFSFAFTNSLRWVLNHYWKRHLKNFSVIIPDQRGHHMLTIFGVVKLVDVKKYCVDIFLYSKHHGE